MNVPSGGPAFPSHNQAVADAERPDPSTSMARRREALAEAQHDAPGARRLEQLEAGVEALDRSFHDAPSKRRLERVEALDRSFHDSPSLRRVEREGGRKLKQGRTGKRRGHDHPKHKHNKRDNTLKARIRRNMRRDEEGALAPHEEKEGMDVDLGYDDLASSMTSRASGASTPLAGSSHFDPNFASSVTSAASAPIHKTSGFLADVAQASKQGEHPSSAPAGPRRRGSVLDAASALAALASLRGKPTGPGARPKTGAGASGPSYAGPTSDNVGTTGLARTDLARSASDREMESPTKVAERLLHEQISRGFHCAPASAPVVPKTTVADDFLSMVAPPPSLEGLGGGMSRGRSQVTSGGMGMGGLAASRNSTRRSIGETLVAEARASRNASTADALMSEAAALMAEAASARRPVLSHSMRTQQQSHQQAGQSNLGSNSFPNIASATSSAAKPRIEAKRGLAERPWSDVPLTFPQKLMEILSNPQVSDIVTWLPHGKGFLILQKRKFAAEVMPLYFKHSKFTSFTRKLNRWGFVRVSKGPEMGAYYHKFFQRGNYLLCMQMHCNSSGGGATGGLTQKEDAKDSEKDSAKKEEGAASPSAASSPGASPKQDHKPSPRPEEDSPVDLTQDEETTPMPSKAGSPEAPTVPMTTEPVPAPSPGVAEAMRALGIQGTGRATPQGRSQREQLFPPSASSAASDFLSGSLSTRRGVEALSGLPQRERDTLAAVALDRALWRQREILLGGGAVSRSMDRIQGETTWRSAGARPAPPPAAVSRRIDLVQGETMWRSSARTTPSMQMQPSSSTMSSIMQPSSSMGPSRTQQLSMQERSILRSRMQQQQVNLQQQSTLQQRSSFMPSSMRSASPSQGPLQPRTTAMQRQALMQAQQRQAPVRPTLRQPSSMQLQPQGQGQSYRPRDQEPPAPGGRQHENSAEQRQRALAVERLLGLDSSASQNHEIIIAKALEALRGCNDQSLLTALERSNASARTAGGEGSAPSQRQLPGRADVDLEAQQREQLRDMEARLRHMGGYSSPQGPGRDPAPQVPQGDVRRGHRVEGVPTNDEPAVRANIREALARMRRLDDANRERLLSSAREAKRANEDCAQFLSQGDVARMYREIGGPRQAELARLMQERRGPNAPGGQGSGEAADGQVRRSGEEWRSVRRASAA